MTSFNNYVIIPFNPCLVNNQIILSNISDLDEKYKVCKNRDEVMKINVENANQINYDTTPNLPILCIFDNNVIIPLHNFKLRDAIIWCFNITKIYPSLHMKCDELLLISGGDGMKYKRFVSKEKKNCVLMSVKIGNTKLFYKIIILQ